MKYNIGKIQFANCYQWQVGGIGDRKQKFYLRCWMIFELSKKEHDRFELLTINSDVLSIISFVNCYQWQVEDNGDLNKKFIYQAKYNLNDQRKSIITSSYEKSKTTGSTQCQYHTVRHWSEGIWRYLLFK